MKITKIEDIKISRADQLPDIDIDFEASRRDDVKRYVERKYGINYVCSIGTYSRLKLKSALKDFCRVEGMQFKYVNYITSHIDDQLEYSWGDLFKYALGKKELYKFIQDNPELVNSIKCCLNQPKSASVHASAIIIVPNKDNEGNDMTIFDWMPIRKVIDGKNPEGVLISEWEGKYIDRAGFLKEDLLGLLQLDKFHNIMRLIEQNGGNNVDLSKIPLDDKKVMKTFKRGMNEDVFQFGTSGLKNYTRFVKPDGIEDLIAMNALYRPGPKKSNAHTDFALFKQGKKKPKYDYMLQSVTEKTSGLYIYQEQIMKALNVLGGFTLVESDVARTQIKKFDKKGMLETEEKFISGAVKNGCKKAEAKEIWAKLLAFSGYGFNRSHSAAYSLIAYRCQYLKVHYPLEFWTTSLQYVKHINQIINRVAEMNRISNIRLYPVDINKSVLDFVGIPEDNAIYWNLKNIKGIGDKVAQKIVDERNKNGSFTSLQDFVDRMSGKRVGKDKIESLIICGAFDNIYGIKSERDRGDIIRLFYDQFGQSKLDVLNNSDVKKSHYWVLLQREYTGYGIIDYVSLLKNTSKLLANLYMSGDEIMDCKEDWKNVSTAGRIMHLTKRSSKRGEFVVLTIESNEYIVIVVVWNDKWEEYCHLLTQSYEQSKLISLNGKIKYDDYRNQNVIFTNENTKIIQL